MQAEQWSQRAGKARRQTRDSAMKEKCPSLCICPLALLRAIWADWDPGQQALTSAASGWALGMAHKTYATTINDKGQQKEEDSWTQSQPSYKNEQHCGSKELTVDR